MVAKNSLRSITVTCSIAIVFRVLILLFFFITAKSPPKINKASAEESQE